MDDLFLIGNGLSHVILAFKRRFPNARIIAFEPDPQFLPVLRRNLARNGMSDVEVVGKAIWYRDGKATWYCEGIDGSKLTRKNDDPSRLVTVDTIDISKYLSEPIDLIKVDIEGSEYEVITHLSGKLSHVKNMTIECHLMQETIPEFCQMINILREEGFNLGINSLNWRDLVNQAEIPPEHFSQYIVVAAWRRLPVVNSANYSHLQPYMPVDYEVFHNKQCRRENELDALEKELFLKKEGIESEYQNLLNKAHETEELLLSTQTKEHHLNAFQKELLMKQEGIESVSQNLQLKAHDTEELLLSTQTKEHELDDLQKELFQKQEGIKFESQNLQNKAHEIEELLLSTQNKERELNENLLHTKRLEIEATERLQSIQGRENSNKEREDDMKFLQGELEKRLGIITAREQNYNKLLIVRTGRWFKQKIKLFLGKIFDHRRQ